MDITPSSPVRVLAVDDEEDILDLYREFLCPEVTGSKLEVTYCKQAEEAVAIIQEGSASQDPYSVVFLDILLPPGRDGVWAAEQIRAIDPRISIVIVTGLSDIPPEEIVKRVPPADKLLYLRKPFAAEEIRHFAYALGEKWKQESRLLSLQAELEARIEEAHAELVKANERLKEEIEERKRTEQALRESEETYRTVLEANPDPVVVYDIEGRVLYFNPAFTRVFGWSLEERLVKKMDLFVPEECWSETKMMIDKVLAGESFSGIETQRFTKEGKIIPVSISGAIYRDKNGEPVGSVINLRDISEQKCLEAQLRQAQKMEAVGTLAGGIAHDFNNLLQAIQGYAELLLLQTKADDKGWRELQEIARAAKRGGDLTKQLLTFSRNMESDRRPLDLNQEIGQVQKLLERTIPKMINIELKLADDLKIVNADPGQIEQVLINLAVNAKDAMPDGGKLTIETRNVVLNEELCRLHSGAESWHYVLLEVTDTGHGMDSETLEHIFEPFFSTKEPGRGTGLGLAMVYGIVKSHQGFISCSSRPNQGTTFRIYLPALEEGKEAPATQSTDSSCRAGNETILLVDDEKYIRELGEQILTTFGYEVLLASDGEKALEIYRQNGQGIELVILDLIMPGMGGKQCLQELRQLDPQVRVVISSGYFPDDPSMESFKDSANGFVTKPYDVKQLLAVVRHALDDNQYKQNP
ncbi:MAG: response regulator [Deltaproteobacteria bacterium]|nr:response regulator [Deltaproteobacteria bacterium]MBW2072809.1 response regulator [Deltaproteobacteria bacterium]